MKKVIKFKDALKKVLDKEEFKIVKTAHDILGEIAIIEIPEELIKKEKIIAQTLIQTNPKIKTVLKKAEQHSGVFRLQKLKWLAGKKTKICEYKENNIRLRFNVEKTYFSSRLSTERLRISKQVKSNEKVLVMFSGAGPYVCVIAKNTKANIVVGVEINPFAHEYAKENIKLNKIKNAILINKDVHKLTKQDLIENNAPTEYDRIIMPLPKTADEFLDDALKFSKNNTIIHLYDFLHEKEFYISEKKIKNFAKKNSINVEIISFTKCGQYSPRKYRTCTDFRIIK